MRSEVNGKGEKKKGEFSVDSLVYGLPELICRPFGASIHADWRFDLERRRDQVRNKLGLTSRGVTRAVSQPSPMGKYSP